MQDIKEKLKDYCITHTEQRIQEIVLGMDQAQESLVSDTKSSAGDKYETSREMIQQDLTRYQGQLLQAKNDLNALQQLSLKQEVPHIVVGSLIITDRARYFIAISLGRVSIDGTDFMVISVSSPIGQLFKGKVVGDSINFNGAAQQILSIV